MQFRLPREHGTWGMFFIPFALGWAAAGRTNLALLLLLTASAAVFFSRETLLFWWRARHWGKDTDGSGRALLVYAAVAGLAAAPLVFVYHLYAVIPLGLVGVATLALNAEMAVRRQGRTVTTEAVAVITASMNAAAAHYAAAGVWTSEAVWLWVLSALYFASSIFYVKLRVQDAHGKSPDAVRAARRRCALYHGALVLAFALLIPTHSLPLFTVVAFAPILARAFLQVIRPARQLNLKRVGWLEVTYSMAFLITMAVGFRSH